MPPKRKSYRRKSIPQYLRARETGRKYTRPRAPPSTVARVQKLARTLLMLQQRRKTHRWSRAYNIHKRTQANATYQRALRARRRRMVRARPGRR